MAHILIADDDQFITSGHARAFERAGYTTAVANDGHAAVEKLVERRPNLVLLDLLLPGIDGIGVLKFIRSRPDLENLPVFILSNSTYFSGIVQSAWKEGATKFIRKGELSPAELVEEVRQNVRPDEFIDATLNKNIQIDYQPIHADAGATAARPKAALIADDDRTIHGVLSYFLGQAGFKVESAFNGLEALNMARTKPPRVLILDRMMPIKDGFATLEEWHNDPVLSSIPVIMLTASTDDANNNRALKLGVKSFLTKPFSPDTLVQLATKLVGSR